MSLLWEVTWDEAEPHEPRDVKFTFRRDTGELVIEDEDGCSVLAELVSEWPVAVLGYKDTDVDAAQVFRELTLPSVRVEASGAIPAAKAVVILSERVRGELIEITGVTDEGIELADGRTVANWYYASDDIAFDQYFVAPEDWVAYFGRTWLNESGAVPAAIDLSRPGDGEAVIEVADTSLGHVVLLNDTPILVADRVYRA